LNEFEFIKPMNYTVTPNENYCLIKLGAEALAPANTEKLKAECAKLVKANPFLIFNCKELKGIDKEQKHVLMMFNEMAAVAGGSIILSELHDDMIELMEEAQVNCVPTDEEAIDFIFMEQIEKQFFDEDEEDEDFE
jgi:anti-sigma B factor antagonist